jgi:hypothetical protein
MAETAKDSAGSNGTHGRADPPQIDEQASKKLRQQGHQRKASPGGHTAIWENKFE